MLASMSQIDPRADAPLVDWSDLGVSGLLPTGTVTLLLADVEGSTRLWETQPDEMTAAVSRLNRTVSDVIAAHDGVRPVEQGEGDSFVVAFARASDAVACALGLQRAPLAPISLRIGVHTGEVQLRDEGNYIGPTINRTARLRDLAHGGQTVLSGATEPLVVDRLPGGVWLTDLGSHPLRDLPRPERVVQLCHPDLVNEFPPLRTPKAIAASNLPVQLTSFVGRGAELAELGGKCRAGASRSRRRACVTSRAKRVGFEGWSRPVGGVNLQRCRPHDPVMRRRMPSGSKYVDRQLNWGSPRYHRSGRYLTRVRSDPAYPE